MLGSTSTVLPGPGPVSSSRASAIGSAFTSPPWPGLGTSLPQHLLAKAMGSTSCQASAMGNEFTVSVQGRIVSSERDRQRFHRSAAP